MSTVETAIEGDRPDEVLTFGGTGGQKYHRIVEFRGEIQPACSQTGRNPLRKDRAVIESHYEPCQHCFPNTDQ